MNIKDKVYYWLDIADYDLKTAISMHKSGRYLYTIFTCQQSIEKLLKALILKKSGKEAPKSHNLVFLQSISGEVFPQYQIKIISELTAFYIEGRYPTYKQKLSKLIDKKKSQVILSKTKELFKCIRSKAEQEK